MYIYVERFGLTMGSAASEVGLLLRFNERTIRLGVMTSSTKGSFQSIVEENTLDR